MARKAAPGTLIHCDACGEDYSATYKRCPFCGEKPDSWPTAPVPPVEEDDFVFEGQDLFDEDEEERETRPARPKGGKRLAQDSAPGPINWPRLITFICSLVIIAAALVIVFSYIYPRVHNNDNPVSVSPAPQSAAPSLTPSDEPTDEPSDTPTAEPSDAPSDEPTTEPSAPVTGSVTSLSLNREDFTLPANSSFTIQATVAPASWTGTVSWSSSNTNIATVSANGTVTNVNSQSSSRSATITATAGGVTATCIVRCAGGSSGTAEPSTNPGSGSLTLNREDFTLNVGGQTFTMTASGADSVTWSISDQSVATISSSGVVTPVGAGRATITATAPDGRTATCIVRVRD